jgi:hypothetical protein
LLIYQIFQTVSPLQDAEVQIYNSLSLSGCRFTTPQDAGITVFSMGGWDTHSSAF